MSKPRHPAAMAHLTNGLVTLLILSSSHNVMRVKYTEHKALNSPRIR